MIPAKLCSSSREPDKARSGQGIFCTPARCLITEDACCLPIPSPSFNMGEWGFRMEERRFQKPPLYYYKMLECERGAKN